jgi:hypothetical protein
MPNAHGACGIFIVGCAVGLTPGCRRGRGLLHHPRRLYAIRILWCQRRTLRCPPIDRLEKHRQLRRAQTHRSALGPGPNESSPAPQSLVKQTKAVLAIPQNLDFVAESNDIQHTDLKVLLLSIDGIRCMVSGCRFFGAQDAGVKQLSTSRCPQACRARYPRGCAIPRSAGPCRRVPRKSH